MTAGVDASEPFRLGINYWPARTAMRWWTSFDEMETAGDFERIAEAGFDSVRVFLLWEAFQPEPEHVDPEMLERLVTVANVARAAGLHLMPTLFTGHMSGVDWIPGWALGGAERDARFRVVSGGRVVEHGLRTGTSTTTWCGRKRCSRAGRRTCSPDTTRCGRGTLATRTRIASFPRTASSRGAGCRR